MKAFKKPLSAEEERYYVERYRLGDEQAKDIWLERNLRLGNPPVISLVHENAVLFDCRTLLAGQLRDLPELVRKAAERSGC